MFVNLIYQHCYQHWHFNSFRFLISSKEIERLFDIWELNGILWEVCLEVFSLRCQLNHLFSLEKGKMEENVVGALALDDSKEICRICLGILSVEKVSLFEGFELEIEHAPNIIANDRSTEMLTICDILLQCSSNITVTIYEFWSKQSLCFTIYFNQVLFILFVFIRFQMMMNSRKKSAWNVLINCDIFMSFGSKLRKVIKSYGTGQSWAKQRLALRVMRTSQ